MARIEEPIHMCVNEIARIPVGAEIRGGVMISAGDIRIDGNYFGISGKRRKHAFKTTGEIRLHVPAGNYDADLDWLRGHFSFASIAASSAQAPASAGSVAILPSGTLKNAS